MKKQNNLRVCMLQPFLTPYRQGLFNELNQQLGGELTMLYFFQQEKAPKWTYERNVEFREIQLKSSMKPTSYHTTRARLSFPSLVRALLKVRPAVVICTEAGPGRLVRLAQLFLRFRIICWTEENEISLCGTRPKAWLIRWMDRGVSSFVLPGRLSQKYVQQIRNYRGPVWFAPNTIDRVRFSAPEEMVHSKFQQDELRFLFSGSLIPRKGIDSLFAAFERLAESDGVPAYRLDIIGDGPLEKKPIANVHYHGFLTQDECAVFMKQAHVLVLTSLWDCNPLVVAEAVTAGCLTVLSDGVGNWPEYTDGNGFVFERGNADELHGALLKVLGMDRDERVKMALRSLEIAADVSHENSARVFTQAIHECCAK